MSPKKAANLEDFLVSSPQGRGLDERSHTAEFKRKLATDGGGKMKIVDWGEEKVEELYGLKLDFEDWDLNGRRIRIYKSRVNLRPFFEMACYVRKEPVTPVGKSSTLVWSKPFSIVAIRPWGLAEPTLYIAIRELDYRTFEAIKDFLVEKELEETRIWTPRELEV